MFTKRVRRMVCALAITAVLVSVPGAAAAYDGEVGDILDTDSITDIYISGSRATVDADYLRDCPGLISDCWIDVRFASQCPEFWCGWNWQNWRRLNASGIAQADCTGASNNDNIWKAEYRIGYAASVTKTVEFWGENEFYWSLGGFGVYRLIGEVLFNVSNNTGTRIGTKITTVTAQVAHLYAGEFATSGGYIYITC